MPPPRQSNRRRNPDPSESQRQSDNQGKIANGLNRTIRRAYERFLKIRGSPSEIARGFALGLFVGMSPTIGFQMPIAIFLAALLKWNKISAAAGVWITNPLTAPLIYSFTYFTGAKLLDLKISFNLLEGLDLSTLSTAGPQIILALVVGGVVIGLPLAVPGYYLSYYAVHGYQTRLKHRLVDKKKKIVQRIEKRRRKKSKKKNRRKQ
jgi:uncharacterized protein (DUF2062 family)